MGGIDEVGFIDVSDGEGAGCGERSIGFRQGSGVNNTSDLRIVIGAIDGDDDVVDIGGGTDSHH